MKKLFIFFTFMFVSFNYAFSQEFPYGKMLNFTDQDFKEAKFKYDLDKNQWILKKSNGLQGTMNVLSALNGQSADIRPHKDDYIVIIQKGIDNKIAYIDVAFYDDEIYHKILTFAIDNGSDILETNSGKLSKCQFNYNDYSFLLQFNVIGIQANTSNTRARTKTIDESYNQYDFVIYTGVEPSSPYLTREAVKQQKRDEKGKKKRSAADLM